MRVTITGATGFIGRRLVDRLLDSGHEVTALTRDSERARELLPVRCHIKAWDGRTADASLVRDVDALVHLAGAGVADRRWSTRRKQEIHDSRVAGSRALVQAIGTAVFFAILFVAANTMMMAGMKLGSFALSPRLRHASCTNQKASMVRA